MPRLQLCNLDLDRNKFSLRAKLTHQSLVSRDRILAVEESSRAAAEVRNALALASTMSQRMKDLAREFDCLGYFDSDDDGPKAA